MINCQKCHMSATLPIKLSCGDDFCFLCIKSHYLNGNKTCPKCHQNIHLNQLNVNNLLDTSDLGPSRKIYWLYSARFGDNWWCYSSDQNIKIENMYSDFLKSMGIINDEPDPNSKTSIIDYDTGVNHTANNFDNYILSVCDMDFKVDFKQMVQINTVNSNQKRSLKRVIVNDLANYKDIVKYLQDNHRVIGIAGIKFE